MQLDKRVFNYSDKNEKKNVLTYKEIQKGAVAKSCT
jgi:hypothetical protein